MKRIGLLLLAVLMVAGLAGCNSGGDEDADPVGTWAMYFTVGWGTTINGPVTWHIYSGGTFAAGDNRGTWSVDGNTCTLILPIAGGYTCTGTIEKNNTMAGTMVWPAFSNLSESTGTFSAIKTSDTP